jgi:hypothetical protein
MPENERKIRGRTDIAYVILGGEEVLGCRVPGDPIFSGRDRTSPHGDVI